MLELFLCHSGVSQLAQETLRRKYVSPAQAVQGEHFRGLHGASDRRAGRWDAAKHREGGGPRRLQRLIRCAPSLMVR